MVDLVGLDVRLNVLKHLHKTLEMSTNPTRSSRSSSPKGAWEKLAGAHTYDK